MRQNGEILPLAALTYASLGVALAGLLLAVLVLGALRGLRSNRHSIRRHGATALLLAQLVFMLGINQADLPVRGGATWGWDMGAGLKGVGSMGAGPWAWGAGEGFLGWVGLNGGVVNKGAGPADGRGSLVGVARGAWVMGGVWVQWVGLQETPPGVHCR